jgi:hypothetical protein
MSDKDEDKKEEKPAEEPLTEPKKQYPAEEGEGHMTSSRL